MAAFLVAFALLLTVVVAIVLRPLWRATPWPAAGLAGMLAITAVLLYLMVGTPAALDPAAVRAPATLQEGIAQLEAQLRRDPDQAEGWRLLGRAYASEQETLKARDAYARAAQLAPDQPDVLVDAAEASALADPQHRFDAAAIGQLEHALQLQPRHQRARWFLGIAQRQAGRPAEAAKTWEPLLAQVDPRTGDALRAQIDAAREEAGLPALPAPKAAGNALRVAVRLDPQLTERVRLRGDASVFVIARVPGGSPMPVAVEKHLARELPFEAALDDGDSPMPTQKLSTLKEVELVARLSASGDPMPQSGDLESSPVRVRVPATGPVTLTIGAVHR